MTEPLALRSHTRSYPKRKRVDVSYLEFDSYTDAESDDDVYQPSMEKSLERNSHKKRKTTTSRSPKKPSSKRKTFPFLRLPAEIRNLIYEYSLTDPSSLHLISTIRHCHRTVRRAGPKRPKLSPALLAVNKQIHAEAWSFLYPSTIDFENTTALHHFVANLSPGSRSRLRGTFRLLQYPYSKMLAARNEPAFTLLAQGCTNVARIEIDCSIGISGVEPRNVARRIYRDTYHWLEAVGRETGVWDEGVGRIEFTSEDWFRCQFRGMQNFTPEARDRCRKEFGDELRELVRTRGKGAWKGRLSGRGPRDGERG